MAKRIYRAESINNLDVAKLLESVRGRRVTFAVDVAKRDLKAVFMEVPEKVLCSVRARPGRLDGGPGRAL